MLTLATVDQVTRLESSHLLWRSTLFEHRHTDALGRIVPDGPHQDQFWSHVWNIKPGLPAPPLIAVWARGGGKSTSAEEAVIALGARRRRLYTWYVCDTQSQADDHVTSIGGMLESPLMAAFYPDMANRAVGKYSASKGWRRNRLRTESGFTVDAIGLDKATRGSKIDENRPDLIILDDIDAEDDTAAAVDKKLSRLRHKIIPAGDLEALVIIGVQNLIHPGSVFSKIVDDDDDVADFLTERILIGPVPAVTDLEYVKERTTNGTTRYRIVDGTPTWVGQDLEQCERKLNEIGPSAFESEYQHNVEAPVGDVFHLVDFDEWLVDPWEVPDLRRTVVWIDPAVTDTDNSDSQAVLASGIDDQRRIWHLWAFERRTSPVEACRQGILAAVRYGADWVGIETDQGGDTWDSVYREAAQSLIDEALAHPVAGEPDPRLLTTRDIPRKTDAKAGGSRQSKKHRVQQTRGGWELGRNRIVRGTHRILIAALRRFPRVKPFDLADVSYWVWKDLDGGGVIAGSAHDHESEYTKPDSDDPYAVNRRSVLDR